MFDFEMYPSKYKPFNIKLKGVEDVCYEILQNRCITMVVQIMYLHLHKRI